MDVDAPFGPMRFRGCESSRYHGKSFLSLSMDAPTRLAKVCLQAICFTTVTCFWELGISTERDVWRCEWQIDHGSRSPAEGLKLLVFQGKPFLIRLKHLLEISEKKQKGITRVHIVRLPIIRPDRSTSTVIDFNYQKRRGREKKDGPNGWNN